MGRWPALLTAMRTWRTRRISRLEVDRLIAGGSPGSEHRGLGALLGAAKAPPSAGELAGERAAVAGFVAARRATAPPRGKNRVRVPLSVRTITMKVAAAIVVLTASGTALAARTGNLPDPAQERAHALFAIATILMPNITSGSSCGADR